MRTTHWITCATLVAGVALLGCSRTVVHKTDDPELIVIEKTRPAVVVVEQQHQGPPPHAPANGYRRKHAAKNVVLVYDNRLQVYVVESHRDCYYSAGQYFNFRRDAWHWSVDVDGPWRPVLVASDVPPGLRKMCTKAYRKAHRAEPEETAQTKKIKSRDDD